MRYDLDGYISLAKNGTKQSVDTVMTELTPAMSIGASKIIDYALSFVESDEGLARMVHYLFHGTQIQRNYCTLFFNRRGDWPLVRQAYEQGLIDAIQAWSR